MNYKKTQLLLSNIKMNSVKEMTSLAKPFGFFDFQTSHKELAAQRPAANINISHS